MNCEFVWILVGSWSLVFLFLAVQAIAPLVRKAGPPINNLILGTLCGAQSPTLVAPALKSFFTHIFCLGVSGTGKSKLMEQLCRELTMADTGYALIDPNSDAADDVFRWFAANYKTFPEKIKKVHYLKLGDLKYSFRYNPFDYRPDPNDPFANSERGKRAWLDSRCEDLAKIITRKMGQSEAEAAREVRFKRWLKNVLYAIGIANLNGHKFSIAEHAIPLLSPAHPDHDQYFHVVGPLLPPEYLDDFEKLRQTRSARQQEEWVESTINRLRETLCHQLVREVFQLDRPSIDIKGIIQRGEILLVSLGKTPVFHEEAAKTLGGLLIREINDAVRTTKRQDRKRFFLLVDEAHTFVNEDMLGMMREARKYQFSVGLFAQQLDNFRYGDVDLVPTLIGMCRMRLCFGMRYQPHAEEVSLSIAYPLLDFTELVHTVERDDGYEWVTVVSESQSKSKSSSQGHTYSKSEGIAKSLASTKAIANGTSRGRNWATSFGNSFSRALSTTLGRTLTITKGASTSRTETDQESSGGAFTASLAKARAITSAKMAGRSVSEPERDPFNRVSSANVETSNGNSSSTTEGESESTNWGTSHAVAVGSVESSSVSNGSSHSEGITDSQGNSSSASNGGSESSSVTYTDSTTKGLTKSENTTRGISITESCGETNGQSFTPTPLHKVREEKQQTGQLQMSVNDQVACFTADLMKLPDQHCLVSIQDYGRCFFMRVADVFDPLNSIKLSNDLQELVIDHVRAKLANRFPYQVANAVNAPVQRVVQAVVKPHANLGPFQRRQGP